MTASSTLQCRLICACNLAYDVRENGPFTPSATSPYAAGAGLKTGAMGFVDPLALHVCLVGTFQDGVFIAFKGTHPLNDHAKPLKERIRDWVNDFRAVLVSSASLPGRVHQGFLAGLDAVWPSAMAEAQRQLDRLGPGARLFITGHSKGGGIAPLAAMRWYLATGTKPTTVTFAAPKAGNEDFHDAVESAKLTIERFDFRDDFVPHLPPSSRLLTMLESFIGEDLGKFDDFNYQHVGQLHFIDWNNVIQTPSNVLTEFILNSERLASAVRLIAQNNADQIVNDHRIGCGLGFIKAVCAGEVCP